MKKPNKLKSHIGWIFAYKLRRERNMRCIRRWRKSVKWKRKEEVENLTRREESFL